MSEHEPRAAARASHLKKSWSPSRRRVGTHGGVFHADDVVACYMLTHHVAKFAGAEIIRTRDERILSSCHALVDVGGVSDGSTYRFDHHQSHFHETFSSEHRTRLSSAGLVFKHFGREVISSILSKKQGGATCGATSRQFCWSDVDILVRETYTNFIEAIDGKDNGISEFACASEPHSHLLKSRYRNVTDLTSRISMLNPFWNETPSAERVMDRFEKAMRTAGRELEDCVFYLGSCWLPARQAVRSAMDNRFDVDSEGRVIVLDRYVPWMDHFFEYERELFGEDDEEDVIEEDDHDEDGGAKRKATSGSRWRSDVCMIIFGDTHSKTYRIQSIPVDESNRFENRCPFPREWRGLNGERLSDAVGLGECVFVHANGFMGGHKQRGGAVEMAKMALDWAGVTASRRTTRMESIGSGESSCLVSSGEDEECSEEEGRHEVGERSVFLDKTRTFSENTSSTTSLSVSLSLGEIALGIKLGTNRNQKFIAEERFSTCEDSESCVGINFLKFFGA